MAFRDDMDAMKLREEHEKVLAQLQDARDHSATLNAALDQTTTELRLVRGDNKKLEARASEFSLLNRVRGTFAIGVSMIPVGLAGGAVFAVIAWIAQSCDDPTITAGVVSDRIHYEARNTTVCTPSGKTTTCHTVHHPEHWAVIIAHRGISREVGLEHDRWMRTYVGQWLCAEEPCESNEISEER